MRFNAICATKVPELPVVLGPSPKPPAIPGVDQALLPHDEMPRIEYAGQYPTSAVRMGTTPIQPHGDGAIPGR